MKRNERVLAALNHKETDIVPYFVEFTEQERKRVVAYAGDENILDKWGLHLHYTQYWGWPAEIPGNSGHFKDVFGVVWDRSGADKDIGVVRRPVISDLDDFQYTFPSVDEKRLRKEYETLISTKEDKFVMAGIGFLMYERLWSLCGVENALAGMLESPQGVHKLLDMAYEHYEKVVDIALEYEIDGFYFGDDWGQQKGLIMGPKHWRTFIKPQMKKLYEKVKNKGKYVIQHSCGDISEILTDLIEIGCDCYQTVQPEIYNLETLKKEYGMDLSFWGAVSTQQLLANASPDKVKEETARIIGIMGRNGGYIAAPTHAVPPDVPPENIIAMMDVFINQ